MINAKKYGKDFTLVVVGQIVSLFGNAILRFSLPLYLLRETGSSTLFGIVTACSFLPMIVLSLLGGVLADRVNKRNAADTEKGTSNCNGRFTGQHTSIFYADHRDSRHYRGQFAFN